MIEQNIVENLLVENKKDRFEKETISDEVYNTRRELYVEHLERLKEEIAAYGPIAREEEKKKLEEESRKKQEELEK